MGLIDLRFLKLSPEKQLEILNIVDGRVFPEKYEIEIDCEDVANEIHTISYLSSIDWDEWIENGETDDDPQIDIRLQVTDDNGYFVHYGISDFDSDHHGAWGSSSVGRKVSMETAKAIAKDLIEQAAEAADCCLTKSIKVYNDDN